MRLAALRGLLSDVLDFCYPGHCAVCDADCAGAAPLCPACAETMGTLERGAACGRCAKPLVDPEDPCPYCLGKGMRPYERIARLGVFREPLRPLIHTLKYHRRWPLAEYLADRLAAQERVRRVLADADCLVAVPLHRLRQMSRGYNQSDVLACALARTLGRPPSRGPGGGRPRVLPVTRPAVRLRHTESQTNLRSKAQREENLRDAFGLVRPEAVRGKRVVVVDDVMTTGATLRSFARCLRPARPAALSAIVLAVADPKGADFQII